MKKSILYTLLILILLIALDILVRIYYCQGIYLKLDSSEFNNVASPIISLLGFVGIIVTIIISLKQFKSSISEKYLLQFNDYIKSNYEEIKGGEIKNSSVKKNELLNFYSFIEQEYTDLLQDENYVINSVLIKQENYNLNPETYEAKLGSLRLFNMQSRLLYKEYFNKLREIIENKQIIDNHKDILLANFIEDIIGYYLASCQIIKENHSEMVEDFFITVDLTIKGNPRKMYYFDKSFFELYDFIMNDEKLRKYYK